MISSFRAFRAKEHFHDHDKNIARLVIPAGISVIVVEPVWLWAWRKRVERLRRDCSQHSCLGGRGGQWTCLRPIRQENKKKARWARADVKVDIRWQWWLQPWQWCNMMPINITMTKTRTLTMTWKRLAFSRLRGRVVVICSWCGWNRIPPRTLASFITSDSSILRTPQTCNLLRIKRIAGTPWKSAGCWSKAPMHADSTNFDIFCVMQLDSRIHFACRLQNWQYTLHSA